MAGGASDEYHDSFNVKQFLIILVTLLAFPMLHIFSGISVYLL